MECLRRGYSPRTIETYNHCLDKFFRIYKKPKQVTNQDVQSYIDQMIKWNRGSSTINVHISALKFYFQKVLKKKLMVEVPTLKRRKRFPTTLTKEETIRLINCIENKKHQLMIQLLYSAGLRVSELLNLKVKDLELTECQGWVRGGKGNKDRPFIIAESIKIKLSNWTKKLSPKEHIFTSSNGKMSSSSIRMILKKAAKKARISKNVHPHTLRHSFAHHLSNRGHAAIEIQPLLGHKNIETTLIYTKMARVKLLNIKSPYDQLQN